MTAFRFSPALPVVLLLALAGCSKDKKEDPQPAPVVTPNRLKYTYAGTVRTHEAANVSASWDAATKTLVVTGTVPTTQRVQIKAVNVTRTGTYPFTRGAGSANSFGTFSSLNTSNAVIAMWSSVSGPAAPAPGRIVITKFDEAAQKVEGTFEFTAQPDPAAPGSAAGFLTVSAGSFGTYKF